MCMKVFTQPISLSWNTSVCKQHELRNWSNRPLDFLTFIFEVLRRQSKIFYEFNKSDKI